MEVIKFFIDNPAILVLLVFLVAIMAYSEHLKSKNRPGNKRKKIVTVKTDYKSGIKSKVQGLIFGLALQRKKPTKTAYYAPVGTEHHTLVVGGSGMGKTSALLIPTLRSIGQTSTRCFVIDISGDIVNNVRDYMSDVLVYAPANPRSIPYNIFGFIDRMKSVDLQDKALARLCLLMLPDDDTLSDNAAYYRREGRKILTAAFIAFYHQGLDFVDICRRINETNAQNLLNLIDASENQHAIRYINSFQGVSDQLRDNAKQETEAPINIFCTDDLLASVVRRPRKSKKDGKTIVEHSFEPYMIENNNCFIAIPDEDLEYYAPLTKILIDQCLDFFKSRSLKADHNLFFCLDEAASIGSFDILPPLRKYRKRKINIMILTQSLADIDLTWGEANRKSMMTNFKYKIVMESSEPDEQEYWAKLCGYKVSTIVSKTSGNGNTTTTISEQRIWNFEPSDFANLGDDLVFIYRGGYKILHKNFYFK